MTHLTRGVRFVQPYPPGGPLPRARQDEVGLDAPQERHDGVDVEGVSLDVDYHLFTARAMQLILRRASSSRESGDWNDDDFDVLHGDQVVGRIYR